MKKINVTEIETSSYVLIEGDTRFKCSHELAEVEPPCCTSRGSSGYFECGCGGVHSVYCPDCNNSQMEQHEVDSIVEAYLGNMEPDHELEACYV